MIFSLSAIPLILAVGLAVDTGRAYVVETRLMGAVDAAALAVASFETTDPEEQAELAWEYFRSNYGLGDEYSVDHVTIVPAAAINEGTTEITSNDGRFVLNMTFRDTQNDADLIVMGETTIPTTFMRVAGVSDMDIAVDNELFRAREGFEIALVLDNTGSMHGNDMTLMTEAARGLVNRLYTGEFDRSERHDGDLRASGDDVIDNLFVSLVPYSSVVNIGRGSRAQIWDEVAGWQTSTFNANYELNYFVYETSDAMTDRFGWLDGVRPLHTEDEDGNPIAWPEPVSIAGGDPDPFYADSFRTYRRNDDQDAYYEPVCVADTEDADNDGSVTDCLTTCVETDEADADGDGDTEECLEERIVYEAVEGDPRGWLGCVMARSGTEGLDDTPPQSGVSSTLFEPYRWVSDHSEEIGDSRYNAWRDEGTERDTNPIYYAEIGRRNDGSGPNLGCPPAITPLTANYSVIMDGIDSMGAWHRGGTWSHLGMVWGWRTISERWRGTWNSPHSYESVQLPLDYDHLNMRKVVVVLTDGQNQWFQDDFTAHGYLGEARAVADGGFGTNNESTATTTANEDMVQVCQAMRGADRGALDTTRSTADENGDGRPDGVEDDAIEIYSIVLETRDQEDTFRNCASTDDHYFFATSSDDLPAIFEQISDDFESLRLGG